MVQKWKTSWILQEQNPCKQKKNNRLIFLISSVVISSETEPCLEQHCLDAITRLSMSVKIPTGVSGTQPSLYTVIMNYE